MSGPQTDPADLLERVGRWIGDLRDRGLAPEASARRLDEVLLRSHGERLDTPDDPLLVAMLCGPTAVGKSSLINAIAGAPISNPGLAATTSHALVYVHERDDPSRLFEYGEALGQLGRDGASLVRHARDELLHKVLVDTPDIDSVMVKHHAVTEALVHCADLVLFVTSPEKYKNVHSARWVAQHRQQRAIAFVLNKWDRPSFGLQYDRRDGVERDFRGVLAAEGFADPLVFKVSTLDSASAAATDLAALERWLAEGLDRSLATAIQERRRRGAWGRLGSALAPIVPRPLADHPMVKGATTRIAESREDARRIAESEVLSLSPRGLDRAIRPSTPGVLGSWMDVVDRMAAATAPVRRFVAWPAGPVAQPATAKPAASGSFARGAADLLATVTGDLSARAEAQRVPLGPVGRAWSAEADELGRHLGLLPADVETELTASSVRPSLRRSAGLAVLWAIEILLGLVLLLALWRVGKGFATGHYATGDVIIDTAALSIILVLCGQSAVKLLFPRLGERLRTTVSQRARTLIDETWRRVQRALDDQSEAATRLAEEGRDLLSRIDAVVRSMGGLETAQGVAHLFGDALPAAPPAEPVRVSAAVQTPTQGRTKTPRFD